MTPHDELDLLSSYLDGELGAPERARLDAHMTTCADCRATLGALQATIADLKELPEVAPTPQDSWALRAAIRRARSPMRKWQRASWAAGAVAAAAIAVFAFTLPGGNDGGGNLEAASVTSEAGVPVYQSGTNLSDVDAHARLLSIAGIPTRGAGPPSDAFAGGGVSSPEAKTLDSAAIVTPGPTEFSAYPATSSDMAAIDRCVGVVRGSTQQFLEPIRYEIATFESKAAYLLFFRSADRYELWVVARETCDVLYFSQAGT